MLNVQVDSLKHYVENYKEKYEEIIKIQRRLAKHDKAMKNVKDLLMCMQAKSLKNHSI